MFSLARFHSPARWLLPACLALLTGCAGVKVSSIQPSDYLAQRRADVLTSGQLSPATRESLRVMGSESKPCLADASACRDQLRSSAGLTDEQRLSALSELWAKQAMDQERETPGSAIAAWLESARYAWAYLFFTERSPSERAFEDRQTQVRDYYNYAAQQAVTGLFKHRDELSVELPTDLDELHGDRIRWQQWQLTVELSGLRQPAHRVLPQELVAAASLTFSGLRNIYRRDGFGAELVAVFPPPPEAAGPDPRWGRMQGPPYQEALFPAITALLQFEGSNLAQVLATQALSVRLMDPYRQSEVKLAGNRVPLAGNFTSGYGLWLARSGFSTQAVRSLLGMGNGIVQPQIYLMQPYDPDRRVVVMLHGLASSPEAWINVANEVLGDELLRSNYQIWQVYYPTNAPLALNHHAIREALTETLQHFDPDGKAPASHHLTLVGHSMGGVLSRLMVSSTQGQLLNAMTTELELELSASAKRQLEGHLSEYLEFEPFPQVDSAIFIAAPHRGTGFASNRLARWVANLITLPISMVEQFTDVARAVANAAPRTGKQGLLRIPNGIDNLSDKDPFVRAAAELPISSKVRYHSIIGIDNPKLPLEESSDSIVPYSSAHLAGAASERIVPSGHSVQEQPQSIVEIRRILRSQLQPQ
ncbi:esterase/lipase family protein [Comamonas sp. GB3 AK4-5]|uniref:esterase/lipase family protein n=1 Tax=Comamonas sp. GB3 AK4-5 TaxID=3231487 RepID=UPI00351EEA7A